MIDFNYVVNERNFGRFEGCTMTDKHQCVLGLRWGVIFPSCQRAARVKSKVVQFLKQMLMVSYGYICGCFDIAAMRMVRSWSFDFSFFFRK